MIRDQNARARLQGAMVAKHSILFKVTGSNQWKADTGTLTLFRDGAKVLQSTVFSGGGPDERFRFNVIPSGTFRIRLDIRQVYAAYSEKAGDTQNGMHHWYGIEKIDAKEWQYEWGRFRAALNETSPGLPQAYRGNFLHGKDREDDWTHGCICERSEQILAHLWSLPSQKIDVTVQR